MSVVRWGEDGSGVYIIGTDAGWECVSCWRLPETFLGDLDAMLEHVKWHREQGDIVPSYVEEELRKQDAEYMHRD